jgi:hypothetical protein
MKRRLFRTTLPYALLAIIATFAVAKRLPPKAVAPVVGDHVQYSAEGDGRKQYVVASDLSTGKELWKLEVFHTDFDPQLEQDVQWVFITKLKLKKDSLFTLDEKSRCYSIELKTRHVEKASCDAAFTKEEMTER